MRYSIEHSTELAESLFKAGRFSEARNAFADILNEVPDEAICRNRVRDCLRNLPFGNKLAYLDRCVAQFRGNQQRAIDAVAGWTYSTLIEKEFNQGGEQWLASQNRSPSDTSPPLVCTGHASAYALLADLLGENGQERLFQKMKWVSSGQESATRLDTFAYGNRLDDGYFADSGDSLNICILGGGCCGLTLANCLKLTFGNRMRVLVIENRVSSPHQKLPYTRRWLTHLHSPSLEGFLDPVVTDLFARVSHDPMIGVPVYIFETLLMLSSKCLGVDFYFGEYSELPGLHEIHFDLLFDATGGRMGVEAVDNVAVRENGPTYHSHRLRDYTAGFERYGVPQRIMPDQIEIETAWFGDRLRPLIDGQPIAICNLKITGIRAELFDELIRWCSKYNHDGKFYVWPGNLFPSVNELLVFVCLNTNEIQQFNQLIPACMTIQNVIEKLNVANSLDTRIRDFLRIIGEQNSSDECYVEPPFFYRPYLKPDPIVREMGSGKIAIPIGDSVYNGNPKVGNGLACHIRNVRRFHDVLVANWGL